MSELTDEFKREFARRLCTLPDEEKIAVLDTLVESGWHGIIYRLVEHIHKMTNLNSEEALNFLNKRPTAALFGMWLPFQQYSTIPCKIPNNEHTDVVAKHYKCDGGPGSIHEFCLDHNLQNMRCPIDDTRLTII